MLKIRRPLGRLIFNMGIAIPGKTVFLIETAPWWLLLDNRVCVYRSQDKGNTYTSIIALHLWGTKKKFRHNYVLGPSLLWTNKGRHLKMASYCLLFRVESWNIATYYVFYIIFINILFALIISADGYCRWSLHLSVHLSVCPSVSLRISAINLKFDEMMHSTMEQITI